MILYVCILYGVWKYIPLAVFLTLGCVAKSSATFSVVFCDFDTNSAPYMDLSSAVLQPASTASILRT